MFSLSCSIEDSSTLIDETEELVPSSLFMERFFICHRGLDGYPENTLVAIEAAIKNGYKAVECDIEITKDGIPVLSHDKTIDRCSNGEGKISDMTYEELLQYDFGSWKDLRFIGEKIPTLEEALKICKKYGVILELDLAGKIPGGQIDTVYKVVEKNKMQGFALLTAREYQLKEFLTEKKNVCVSISGIYNLTNAKDALYIKELSEYCNFSMPSDSVNQAIIDYSHANGIKVKIWPVDDVNEANMLFNMGVDYIQTNILGPLF